MTKVTLSSRLALISSFVEKEDVVCDIGSDHGYLALFLAQKFNKRVYASEYGNGPYDKLVDNVKRFGGASLVECYQADGLEKMREDADTLIIAGMGGKTIQRIFLNPNLSRIRKIICEPQSEAFLVRDFLLTNGFMITEEIYVKEREKVYPVIVAKRGEERNPYEDYELEFGRIGIEKKDPGLLAFLRRQISLFDEIKKNGKLGLKAKIEEELVLKALDKF